MEFQIGDRFVVEKVSGLMVPFLVGKTGMVIGFEPDWLHVRMDEYHPRLHNLDGKCEDGHGYYVLKEALIDGMIVLRPLLAGEDMDIEVSHNSLNLLLEG